MRKQKKIKIRVIEEFSAKAFEKELEQFLQMLTADNDPFVSQFMTASADNRDVRFVATIRYWVD